MPKRSTKDRPTTGQDESGDDTANITAHARKRKHQDNETGVEKATKRLKNDFPHLKARTRRIPQELITSEWKRLPEPAQRQVRDIFLLAKRSTVNSIRNTRRRTEAEAAVNAMVRKLEKQLPRMPFPSTSKASHFNLEDVLQRNRALEAEETPALDSVKLLKEEIEREELRIEERRNLLEKLEANAKDAARQRKQQAKASHPLLQDNTVLGKAADDAESIGLVKNSVDDSVLDSYDEHLEPLLNQFRSHLESIRTNGMQFGGVLDGISSAHAALAHAVHQPLL